MLTLDELVRVARTAGFRRYPGGLMRRSFSRKGGQQLTRVQLVMHCYRGRLSVWMEFLNNAAYARTLSITRRILLDESTDDVLLFETFLEQLDGI